MTVLIAGAVILGSSLLAMWVNDKFELGGYLVEDGSESAEAGGHH